MAGAGVHTVMQTVVGERSEHTLAFVMSLPITVREYTSAKLLANLAIFGPIWLTLSAVSCWLSFASGDGLPGGTLPFALIVLVGIFFAYTVVLTASLVSESVGISVAAVVVGNVGKQIYLFGLAGLHGIQSGVDGPAPAWNSTELTILAIQILGIAGLFAITYVLQARKKDFI